MCNENFEFCLDSKCVKNLPLDKYEKDFTFIVNGRRYQTSRIVADLMSPQIRKFHYVDPSIDEFVININIQNSESDYFDEFLSLFSFEKKKIEGSKQKVFLQYFYNLGNIDEYFRLQPNYMQTISIENIIERLHSFTKTQFEINESNDQSKSSPIFDKLIEYASEHFEELDKEKMKELPIDILEEIIRNEKLKLSEEDSLLIFILELYKNDCSYSNLFEYVLFVNVSEENLLKFVNEFEVEHINNQIFHSICDRFFTNKSNEKINEQRYIASNIKEFTPKEDEDFNGIMKYLTNKTGGNIHDNGTIEISSNSIYSSSFNPKNSVDYQNSNIYHSNNDSNSFVLFDFKDKSVQISSYSIQSAPSNTVHLKNWAVEVSEDCQNWQEIDCHSNDSKLNGYNNKSRFEISNPQTKFTRYLRIRQTGSGWYLDYFGFCFIEFYGKLQEPKA